MEINPILKRQSREIALFFTEQLFKSLLFKCPPLNLNFCSFALKVNKLFLCTSVKMFTDLSKFTGSCWWSPAQILLVKKILKAANGVMKEFPQAR
jgi:hypothetical protein